MNDAWIRLAFPSITSAGRLCQYFIHAAGHFGKDAKTAMLRFHQKHGLQATAIYDAATWLALG